MAPTYDSEETPRSTKVMVTGGYMVCSALMLMANKLSVHHLPKPGTVLLIQFLSSAFFAKSIGVLGFDEVDELTWDKVKRYCPAVGAQLMTIFSGIKALQYSNVETFIVFRASVPLFLCLIDYKFLGRELPGTRSALCLSGLLFGTLLYTMTDSYFEIHGYKWIAVWYCAFAFDQAYLKHVVEKVKMTPFGGVLYMNAIGSVPLLLLALGTSEFDADFHPTAWGWRIWLPLGVSCLLGMGLSTFAYRARCMVSATSFAILGNVCKVVTVILNWLFWDKHCTLEGLCGLLICLVCAYFYQQAPKRSEPDKVKEDYLNVEELGEVKQASA